LAAACEQRLKEWSLAIDLVSEWLAPRCLTNSTGRVFPKFAVDKPSDFVLAQIHENPCRASVSRNSQPAEFAGEKADSRIVQADFFSESDSQCFHKPM
jgi:hypothetical protein